MFPLKSKIIEPVDTETYPLVQKPVPPNGPALALVALDHTPVEGRIYVAMLSALATGVPAENEDSLLTARELVQLTGIDSLSTVRRGVEGLVSKFSVQREEKRNGNGGRDHNVAYRVRTPEQVLALRDDGSKHFYARGTRSSHDLRALERVVERVTANGRLSRREAQVVLYCVEGLTNAEIGSRLRVKEQTVKFHLRHIFIKFGVKRRAELISKLLI